MLSFLPLKSILKSDNTERKPNVVPWHQFLNPFLVRSICPKSLMTLLSMYTLDFHQMTPPLQGDPYHSHFKCPSTYVWGIDLVNVLLDKVTVPILNEEENE